jgi:hypothetical protein
MKNQARLYKREREVWVRAAVIRDQRCIPSSKFFEIILCDGTKTFVLVKHCRAAAPSSAAPDSGRKDR